MASTILNKPSWSKIEQELVETKRWCHDCLNSRYGCKRPITDSQRKWSPLRKMLKNMLNPQLLWGRSVLAGRRVDIILVHEWSGRQNENTAQKKSMEVEPWPRAKTRIHADNLLWAPTESLFGEWPSSCREEKKFRSDDHGRWRLTRWRDRFLKS
jgi:hypothetical protein